MVGNATDAVLRKKHGWTGHTHVLSPSVKKLTVGFDYLTMTSSTESSIYKMRYYANAVMTQERKQGLHRYPFRWHGAKGYQTDYTGFCEHDDYAMLQFRHNVPLSLARPLFELQDIRVTRLDMQITAHLHTYQRTLAREIYKVALPYHMKRWGETNRIKPHLWVSEDGDSVLFGSRKSTKYAKVYDKHKQSGGDEYENSWRAEYEVKKPVATSVAKGFVLFECDEASIGHAVNDFILERTGRHFIDPAMIGHGDRIQVVVDNNPVIPKLQWLREQVSPSVQAMIEDGMLHDVVSALGLQGSIFEHFRDCVKLP